MKVIFTAGGGGHFSPTLAVISALPSDIEYQIIGRKYTYEGSKTLSLEYLTAERNNLPFIAITTGRLQRTISKYTLSSLLKIPIGYHQATKILKNYRPDVVISFGGYISVPVVIAAYRLKIPIIIHEQTLEVGLANKIASRFATKICISWSASEKYFPKEKTVLTGNPVKSTLTQQLAVIKNNAYKIPSILVTGGSQGSHKINSLVKGTLPDLLACASVIHQTGDALQFDDYAQLLAERSRLPLELQKRYTLEKFIAPEDMAYYISQSQLIICRAGINTITELLLMKKPALVIPLKDGQAHEQQKNAELFVLSGLGEMIDEDEVTLDEFKKKIMMMLEHTKEYRLKKDMPEFTLHLNAARKIISLIQDVGNQKEN